jgi:ABC-type lipoprotein export system ATPase subunit
MKGINRSDQTTFIFSTHDVRVINQAHRIVPLLDGRIAGGGDGTAAGDAVGRGDV